MILSFRDKRTREFAGGKYTKAYSGFARQAEMKLDQLDAAVSLKDLAVLPGNRFEALKGDRKGQYSIRINDQWRICFEWPDQSLGPLDVEIFGLSLRAQSMARTAIHPGEHLAEQLKGAWHERRRAQPEAQRADQPDYRNPERPACDNRR
jgi:proteic killer suppression protein